MALTAGKKLSERPGKDFSFPVAAGVSGFQGGLVMLASGVAQKAAPAGSASLAALLTVVGVAEKAFTGGAADGDIRVSVRSGIFMMSNSSGVDVVTEAMIGKPCYVVDDCTVAATSGGGLRPKAGVINDVESAGVWVNTDSAVGAGRRTVTLAWSINQTDLLAHTAYDLVSPVVGVISSMAVTVQAAVTTGDAVTAKVGATPVAGLSCAVANAAAKGTIITDAPTAGDASTAVAVGSRIQIVPGAAFAIAGALNGFIEITI